MPRPRQRGDAGGEAGGTSARVVAAAPASAPPAGAAVGHAPSQAAQASAMSEASCSLRRRPASTPAAGTAPRSTRRPRRPIAGDAPHQAGEHQDRRRAEDRLDDLHGRRHVGGQPAGAQVGVEPRQRREEDGIAGRRGRSAARAGCTAVVAGQLGGEAAAVRDVGGERQVLALVVRQRLAGPVAEAEGEPQQQADGDRGVDGAHRQRPRG